MKWLGLLFVLSIFLVACTAEGNQSSTGSQNTLTNKDKDPLDTTPKNPEVPVVDPNPNPTPNPEPIPQPTPPPNPTPEPTPEPSPSGITLSVLAQHDSSSDCWVAYDGDVYDVTTYLPKHPGSASAIIPYCGTAKEFEKAFTNKHGTTQVSRLKSQGKLMGSLI